MFCTSFAVAAYVLHNTVTWSWPLQWSFWDLKATPQLTTTDWRRFFPSSPLTRESSLSPVSTCTGDMLGIYSSYSSLNQFYGGLFFSATDPSCYSSFVFKTRRVSFELNKVKGDATKSQLVACMIIYSHHLNGLPQDAHRLKKVWHTFNQWGIIFHNSPKSVCLLMHPLPLSNCQCNCHYIPEFIYIHMKDLS